jgi:hypothetical protein
MSIKEAIIYLEAIPSVPKGGEQEEYEWARD